MNVKFDPLVAEWIAFARNPSYNLIEKCLKFAQLLEYPDLDMEQYIGAIRKMGLSLRETVTDVKNPTYLVSMLNEYLFGDLGLGGDDEDYFNPKYNFLNEVIECKRGIPITLTILYVEVAKFIGLDLRIVGFPGHILAKYGEEMILDPFYGGSLRDADDLQAMLDESLGIEFRPEHLDEIGTEQILVRMARNLKNSYMQSYVYDKAVRCADMVLAIEPESATDIRDKGILESRLLHHDAALGYLNRYLEMRPNAEDVDHVLEMIRNIKTKTSR
ncbi:MAG: hypothetical protein EB829_02325 [Nitrosopumilus sp. H8]|nr:MAG: hypothetical protein EB830_04635 [Nitrosopumilus sp. H13]RNJ79356.1 MAG: hypothetical protein EB829_02325 [Nitrosopumilus sp. H8]